MKFATNFKFEKTPNMFNSNQKKSIVHQQKKDVLNQINFYIQN